MRSYDLCSARSFSRGHPIHPAQIAQRVEAAPRGAQGKIHDRIYVAAPQRGPLTDRDTSIIPVEVDCPLNGS
jgi:hypothetical protein